MYANNPYAQAGWYNPQNPHSINGTPWRPNGSLPPTFGALPPPAPSAASVLTFEFTSLNPDITNCLVIGPSDRKYFEVRTSNGSTVVSKPGGTAGVITWNRHPTLDSQVVGGTMTTGDYLQLSADRSYRSMRVGGRNYIWHPRSNGIYLYSVTPTPAQLARASLSSDGTKFVLEIVSEAFQAGLFEPCIIATILLFSARNID